MPYTTSQSQTGTTAPSYTTGVAYPLWNAMRKRNFIQTLPDNFTTKATINVIKGQEVVLAVGPSPPNTTGWYNHLITNRVQQLGANDYLDLDGTTGVGGPLQTYVDLPETDPITTWTQSIYYTGEEYDQFYAPFTTGTSVTGTNIPVSDYSLFSQSPTYTTPYQSLPAPEKIIWTSSLYVASGCYNNVSYTQMAEAILSLRSTTAYGSLTVTAILNEYRNLYVADPQQYLPLFDREYNTIVASPDWLYKATPTPNNSLAYIMYFGA